MTDDTTEDTKNEYNTCPECSGEGYYSTLGTDIYMFCDACRLYWSLGSGIFTSYAELIDRGVFDDDIGGASQRDSAIERHDQQLTQKLKEYQQYEFDDLPF